MSKPNYYLWKSQNMTFEEFEQRKSALKESGYRVISYIEGKDNIHTTLQTLIKNHIYENTEKRHC